MRSLPKATARLSGETASLELERALAAGLAPGRVLAAPFHSPEGVVLLREDIAGSGFIAGSLTAFSLEEVFGHVLSGIRSGELVVQSGASRKTVTFRDGQIVFAASTERHERIGALLVRLGLITQEQLASALRQVSPGVRVGQVLTRGGALSEANLYSAMTLLVREIVVDLFEAQEGAFLFVEGSALAADSLKLPERTRDLVLQGLKRGEAVSRLRRRLPDGLRLSATGAAAPPGEEALFEKLARGIELGLLRPSYPGSLYAFLTWVEEGLRSGAIVSEAPAPAPVPALSDEAALAAAQSPEERYNALLSRIWRSMQQAGKDVNALRGFLDTPPEGLDEAYVGVTLSDEGRLDVERIRRNLQGPDEALSRAMAFEALDAFVSYALFAAKNVLPPDVSAELTRAHRALQEGLG